MFLSVLIFVLSSVVRFWRFLKRKGVTIKKKGKEELEEEGRRMQLRLIMREGRGGVGWGRGDRQEAEEGSCGCLELYTGCPSRKKVEHKSP